MKLFKLRVERLKQEVGKLALSTTGMKNELQRRLRKELRHRGIDINTYEFEDEEERELQAPATTSSTDINSVLDAMREKIQVLTEGQEASRAENQKMQEANQKLFDDVQEYSKKYSEQRMEKMQLWQK